MATATGRGEGTRRRIIEAAAERFAQHGYASTSMADLVEATGLTKGAVYFHFASKEQLALEVFRAKHQEWTDRVLATMGSNERAIDQIVQIVRAVARMIQADPSSRCVGRIADELGRDPDLAPQVNRQFDAWVEVSVELLRRAQRDGDVRADLDVRRVSEVVVASFIGLEHVSGLRPDGDLEAWGEELMELVLAAIGTRRVVRRAVARKG